MKGTIAFALVAVLVCGHVAYGQSSMYDYSYAGPRNYYGQPQYEPIPNTRQPQPQSMRGGMPGQHRQYGQHGPTPWSADGYIPRAAGLLQRAGSYFWGYMPASFRGGPDPNALYPSPEGTVSIINVPGSR